MKLNIIRAWKDEEYRDSLSDHEAISLPDNPAGAIELSDELLGDVIGGTDEAGSIDGSCKLNTYGCCPTACGCTCNKTKKCPVQPGGTELW